MSYQLEPTTFSFEEGTLGHRALAKLNELERKINYLVKKHHIDLALTEELNQNLAKLFEKRENFFARVLDHYMDKTSRSIDDERRAYLEVIITLTFVSVLGFTLSDRTDYAILYFGVGSIIAFSLHQFYKGYKALFLACEKHQSFVKFYSSIKLNHIEDKECCICYETMKEGDILIGHLAMSRIPHVFHKVCVPSPKLDAGILKPTYNCPYCRAQILYIPFKNKKL